MKKQIKKLLKEYIKSREQKNKTWEQKNKAGEQLFIACKKEYGNDCKVEVRDKKLYIDGKLTK